MGLRNLIATENQEQRALVKWIRTQQNIRDCVIKLNNEGKRTLAQGWNLKMMGMCPGASDLFLAYPANGYHGLWLEVKRSKQYPNSARTTEQWLAQEIFLERMKSLGYQGFFCYGWLHGKKLIEDYLSHPALLVSS